MTFATPDPPPAVPAPPNAPAPPPIFGQNPTGSKPGKKSQNPTFLGAGDTPTAGQLGSKTLLGQ